MEDKKIQSKFCVCVSVEHVGTGATECVRCVNMKCDRNTRWKEGNMG